MEERTENKVSENAEVTVPQQGKDDPEYIQFRKIQKAKSVIEKMKSDEVDAAILAAGMEQELLNDPDLVENEKAFSLVLKQYTKKASAEAAKLEEKETQGETQPVREVDRKPERPKSSGAAQPQAGSTALGETTVSEKICPGTMDHKDIAKKTGMSEDDALFSTIFPPRKKVN